MSEVGKVYKFKNGMVLKILKQEKAINEKVPHWLVEECNTGHKYRLPMKHNGKECKCRR